VWERQDELWAREELKYMQGQRREQLESEGVYQQAIDGGASEDAARQAQGKWLTDWYGPDAEGAFFNEVLRRWGQADPEALEHLALSHGRDPAAGQLVNSLNPVANVGLVPPDVAGNNTKLFFEYNRTDGLTGPATKFRTDRPNDPLDFATARTAAMVKFFGAEFRTMQTPMIMRLRAQLDAQEGALQGNPRGNVPEAELNREARRTSAPTATEGTTSEVTRGKRSTGGKKYTINFSTGGSIDTDNLEDFDLTPEDIKGFLSPEESKRVIAREMELRGGGGKEPTAEPTAEPTDLLLDQITDTSELNTADRNELFGSDVPDPSNPDFAAAAQGGPLAVGRTAADKLFADAEEADRDTNRTLTDVGGAFTRTAGAANEGMKIIDGQVRKVRPGLDEKPKGFDLVGAIERFVYPSSASEVSRAPGSENVDRSNAMADPEGTAEKVPAATDETAQAPAQSVAAASRSKRRVPFRHELYNAATLVKGGYMAPEDFQTFARTGSLPTNTETQIFNIGNGVLAVARTDELGNVDIEAMQVAGGGGAVNPEDVIKSRQALQNYMEDSLQTIEDKAQRQEIINSSLLASQLLGANPLAMLDPVFQNTMAKAGRLVSRADPDKIQGYFDTALRFIRPGKSTEGFDLIDLNPFDDPITYRGGLGMAIAFHGVVNDNVTDAQDVTVMMDQYARNLQPLGGLTGGVTDQAFINMAREIEHDVRTSRPGSKVTFSDGSSITIEAGNDSPAERRQQILDELLKKTEESVRKAAQ
jgi:hypothetical protein